MGSRSKPNTTTSNNKPTRRTKQIEVDIMLKKILKWILIGIGIIAIIIIALLIFFIIIMYMLGGELV